jgi:hypothetical protein
MWTLFIVSTVIGLDKPKVTRYAEVAHFETCEHAAQTLELEFTQGETVFCEETE